MMLHCFLPNGEEFARAGIACYKKDARRNSQLGLKWAPARWRVRASEPFLPGVGVHLSSPSPIRVGAPLDQARNQRTDHQ